MRGAPEPGAPAPATGHSPRILFPTVFLIDFLRFEVHFSSSVRILRRDSISACVWCLGLELIYQSLLQLLTSQKKIEKRSAEYRTKLAIFLVDFMVFAITKTDHFLCPANRQFFLPRVPPRLKNEVSFFRPLKNSSLDKALRYPLCSQSNFLVLGSQGHLKLEVEGRLPNFFRVTRHSPPLPFPRSLASTEFWFQVLFW